MSGLVFESFLPFPTLATPRLILREIVDEDAPVVFFLRSDGEMTRYIDRAPARQQADILPLMARIAQGLREGSGLTWGLAFKDQPDALIGTIGFWRLVPEHFRAEIGYALHRDHWGQGLMAEALQAVLSFGFTTLGLHSVEANINPSNLPSARLLERAGFLREAYFRENFYYNGQFLDSAIYSKLSPLPAGSTQP